MSTSNTNTFRAGYLFKPTHAPIHFVKEGHGISGDDYKDNFSCNLEDAKTFLSVDSARECIYDLLLCSRWLEHCLRAPLCMTNCLY